MNLRGPTNHETLSVRRRASVVLLASLTAAPLACSLLAESQLSDKPMEGTSGSGGSGGVDASGGGGGTACMPACASGEACCDGTCADTETSAQHCGSCGNACSASERCCGGSVGCAECCAQADCPKDHQCQANACVLVCTAPAVECGDVCATLDESTEHCGKCDNHCLAGHACVLGTCASGWAPMTTDDAPFARQRAAAAWTGAALFVWGGQNAQGALGDGALYDPKTDTWATVSTTNAPAPRVDAVAVWTGDRVLVWGGGPPNDTASLASGKLYDPSTDTWSDVLDAPIGRRAPVALYTGSRVLIWGGSNGGSPIAGGALYDPAMNKWSLIANANAPTARSGTGWAFTGTELLLFGGRPGGAGVSAEGYAYDPSANVWRTLSGVSAPSARYDAFTVWMNGTMLVYGGRDAGGTFDDASMYEVVTDTWSAAAAPSPQDKRSAPAGRTGFSGFTGTVALVAGGLDTSQKPSRDGRTFDPSLKDWAAMIPPWPSTADHEYGVGVWTGAELILWSGLDNGALTPAGERYRP